MAKHNSSPLPSGRSKVRIFFVEADLAAGELRELTDALRSAIRPSMQIVTRTPASLGAGSDAEVPGGDLTEEEAFLDVGTDSEAEEVDNPAAKTASKPRRYRSPKVVNDLPLNAGGKSFKDFAQERGNPEEQTNRYLLAAYWLDAFASVSEASVDHVYSCYKFAGWIYKVSDPGVVFRNLKKEGLGDTKNGKFTINHIGRARVEEMSPSDS